MYCFLSKKMEKLLLKKNKKLYPVKLVFYQRRDRFKLSMNLCGPVSWS